MSKIAQYMILMAGTTYLIRVLPLLLIKRDIQNRFFKSFLYYVPYVCLTAMTFPAILSATASVWSAIIGLGVGIILALREKKLLTVAGFACLAVFVSERVMTWLHFL